MFETSYMLKISKQFLNNKERQIFYSKNSWLDLKKKFNGNFSP
jgi:hypothetical protein